MTTRRSLIAAAAALSLAACSRSTNGTPGTQPSGSVGAAYEKLKRIELIAPAAPGSGWDQTARAVQQVLQEAKLAQSVEVKNVPGASGTVALAQVAPQKGKKDLLIASGLAMMSGVISNGTSVTLNDLTPIARVMGEFEALVTPLQSPYKTVTDLFAAIKANPKSVAIAGGSAGSADHVFIGLLARHFGVEPAQVNYVPFSGGGEATTALLGGKVQAGVAGLNEFVENVKNGKLTGLLLSSTKKVEGAAFSQLISDVDAKLEFQNWRSIMAPGGLPDTVSANYVQALTQMHASKTWTDLVAKNAWADNFLAGAEFSTWIAGENTRDWCSQRPRPGEDPMSSPSVTTPPSDVAGPTRGARIAEWALAGALLLIGIAVLLDGLSQPTARSASGIGAGFMPVVVGLAIIALAVLLGVGLLRGRYGVADEGEGDVDVTTMRWAPLAVTVVAVLLFALGIDVVGFPIVAAVSFWLTAWASGARRHLMAALIAVVLSLTLHLSFTRLLQIDLPAGLLSWIL